MPDGNPSGRSSMTSRSSPSTPSHQDEPPDTPGSVISTADLQDWMSNIEQCLNEVCSIAAAGKLNSDQKGRINSLCLNVAHYTSQIAVEYQSVKQRLILANSSIRENNVKQEIADDIRELKETIKLMKPQQTTVSFADVLKQRSDTVIRPNNLSSIAIYPSNKQQSSEDTKIQVQRLINPEQLKIHVRGLRKTKNGGVIISTETKTDVEKLRSVPQLTTAGLTVQDPLKRNPRITIYNLPCDTSEKELFECLYEQNIAEKLTTVSRDDVISSMKISHKSGRKESALCNFVLEVPAKIRNVLISQERVYINWTSHQIRDFTTVTRCYNCHQYGHAAKHCRDTGSCSHCGGADHGVKDCPKTTEPPKCATCIRLKKPCDHKTGDPNCPARKIAEHRYMNTIDYEG